MVCSAAVMDGKSDPSLEPGSDPSTPPADHEMVVGNPLVLGRAVPTAPEEAIEPGKKADAPTSCEGVTVDTVEQLDTTSVLQRRHSSDNVTPHDNPTPASSDDNGVDMATVRRLFPLLCVLNLFANFDSGVFPAALHEVQHSFHPPISNGNAGTLGGLGYIGITIATPIAGLCGAHNKGPPRPRRMRAHLLLPLSASILSAHIEN